MAGAFAAAMATTTTVRAQSSKDDPNIVNLPAHIKVRGAQIAFSPGFRWGTSLLSGQAITREHVMNQTAVTYPWTTVSDMSGETIKTILEDVCDNFSTPIRITSKAGIWCEQVA